MKVTALFIALAMICMVIEGCDARTANKDTVSDFENGLMRVNQAFIEGFADRPAQIVTLEYHPATSAPRAVK